MVANKTVPLCKARHDFVLPRNWRAGAQPPSGRTRIVPDMGALGLRGLASVASLEKQPRRAESAPPGAPPPRRGASGGRFSWHLIGMLIV